VGRARRAAGGGRAPRLRYLSCPCSILQGTRTGRTAAGALQGGRAAVCACGACGGWTFPVKRQKNWRLSNGDAGGSTRRQRAGGGAAGSVSANFMPALAEPLVPHGRRRHVWLDAAAGGGPAGSPPHRITIWNDDSAYVPPVSRQYSTVQLFSAIAIRLRQTRAGGFLRFRALASLLPPSPPHRPVVSNIPPHFHIF